MIAFLAIVLVFALLWYIYDRKKRRPYVHQVKLPDCKHIATVGRTVEPDHKPENVHVWMRYLRRHESVNFGTNKDNLLFRFNTPKS